MDFFDIVNYATIIDRLLLFLINAVGLELILWSYVANRYTRPSRMLLAGIFYVLLWFNIDAAINLMPVFFSGDQSIAQLWITRCLYAFLSVFFAGFYIFSLNFPIRNFFDKSRREKEIIQIAAWTFFFVTSFTPLLAREIISDPGRPLFFRIDPGPLFWVFAIFASLSLLLAFLEILRNRRIAGPEDRLLAQIINSGAVLFGVSNILFNIIGAVFGGVWEYITFFSLFADYAIIISLGYLSYKVLQEKLFGIKVILVEIFVGLMGASLFVMPFFVEILWQRILLVFLFALFCGFSYLLVKSTVKEYREREILEQRVRERTKELEGAKRNLEEINSVLEVRVKARTVELEKLNRTLEEKVVARTNDLEAKIRDLEKFQRITVGRELKMIELKKEIEYLRKIVSSATLN